MEIRDGFDSLTIRAGLFSRAVVNLFELRYVRYALELLGFALCGVGIVALS